MAEYESNMAKMLRSPDDYPGRMLQQAAIYNNVDFLTSLLQGEEAAYINAQDPFGRTALYTSVTNNSYECGKQLLESGADPNIQCGPQCGCMTPLHAASLDDKFQFVKLLLEHGADMDVKDGSGERPVDLANKNSSQNVLKIFEEELQSKIKKRQMLEGELYQACANGDVTKAQELALKIGSDINSVINKMPSDCEPILFRACKTGDVAMIKFLLAHGAAKQVHPMTGLSPLHAACQANQGETVLHLLQNFPELARFTTTEDVLPLHVAAVHGHTSILMQLLQFEYPDYMVQTYTDKSTSKLYRSAFDINATDSQGHTALHLACLNNHIEAVELLLSHKVKLFHDNGDESLDNTDSRSIDSSGEPSSEGPQERCEEFSPISIDFIDSNGSSPLHMAVIEGHIQLTERLLQHGADVNQPIIGHDGRSTALMEACKGGNAKMMDVLLKHGAVDQDQEVLTLATKSQRENVMAVLLMYKSHIDPEYRVNRKAFMNFFFNQDDQLDSYDSTTSSLKSMCPTTAVSINWHNQIWLPYIKESWLLQACFFHNPSLLVNQMCALFAITRIDISNNNIEYFPDCLFQLQSLRVLNASYNKIRWLPGSNWDPVAKQPLGETCITQEWQTSALEEVQLQYNHLRELPAALFKLPNLHKLQASHNELEIIPFQIWTSAKMTEINLSHNHLKTLPSKPEETTSAASFRPVFSIDEDRANTSVASNNKTGSQGGSQASNSPIDSPSENAPMSENDNEVIHFSYWREHVKIRDLDEDDLDPSKREMQTRLADLNLSNNKIETVPNGLACLAPYLTRLNLSHNYISDFGMISNYPSGLKELNLSYNEIETNWNSEKNSGAVLGSFCMNPLYIDRVQRSKTPFTPPFKRKGRSASTGSAVTSNFMGSCICLHRVHRQLEQLRILRLSYNKMKEIVLEPEEEEGKSAVDSKSASLSPKRRERHNSADKRTSLFFPSLTVLDLSNNSLQSIPAQISEIINFAELKLANNKIKELPPELGLLKKLWNIDLNGCPVEKTLRSTLGEKAKKSAAIKGYLKSIKEEATVYNRMKLMFVGVQGIGKTSLLNQLRKEGRSQVRKINGWAERMGIKEKDQKGENISTVGVDIGDLILQRGNKEVIFRTWDFGGQREYYATHQYFLSKRALYLVVWKITDGEKGINEIYQWLVNIQARAPNSPVVIVGTHLDQLKQKKYPVNFLKDLQDLIEQRFMSILEPEKHGLPRVLDHIEVSCKAKPLFNTHIGDLVSCVLDRVFEEQVPGSRGMKLLAQKIPATYKQLEDVVAVLAEERKQENKDPVLHAEQYKPLVMQKMEEMFNSTFRDIHEMNQATQFLHENGVLLHYEDVNLQDIYFLDPQWLCDMLANVVTVREINSLARNGIMRTEDLHILFKNAAFKPEDIKTYIIDLLNKFEVALLWDKEHLLIPSLLPTENDLHLKEMDVRIPARSADGGTVTLPKPSSPDQRPIHHDVILQSSQTNQLGQSTFYCQPDEPDDDRSQVLSLEDVTLSETSDFVEITDEDIHSITISGSTNPAMTLSRLYLMSYFPSGFWPRLVTRLLGDSSMHQLVSSMYSIPEKYREEFSEMCEKKQQPEWRCWQTGLELLFHNIRILSVKEAAQENPGTFINYRQCRMVIPYEQDQTKWIELNQNTTSILEMLIPNSSLLIQPRQPFSVTCLEESRRETMALPILDSKDIDVTSVQPKLQTAAELLTKIVDHVDTLLEDWYPDLGVRFVQNSQGMYLISHIVPCNHCLLHQRELQRTDEESPDAFLKVDVSQMDKEQLVTQPIVIDSPNRKLSSSSKTDTASSLSKHESSFSESVSSAGSHGGSTLVENIVGAVNQVVSVFTSDRSDSGDDNSSGTSVDTVYCHLVEQCIQSAQNNTVVICHVHGNIGPFFIGSEDGHVQAAHVAPDVVFQDICDVSVVDGSQLIRGRLLGKGAFGSVFAGTMFDRRSGENVKVAIKMLQPVDPGKDVSDTERERYRQDKQRWEKEPLKHACDAYLNVRKELGILMSLHHHHIVPLYGISLHPLSLLLSLAPLGALNVILKDYRRNGARLPIIALQKIIIQVASALDYLHSCQIIYRDLKSENVLVWSLPAPHTSATNTPVEVKLADYGISRALLPSGAKGYAGTPPFIAPEIIQHNGEETYTEKVDCFSFGMFIYELIALKIPFEGQESAGAANIKGYVLAGARPHVTAREMSYPTHVLDLMTLCWSHDPNDRPSASDIINIASCPQFVHLRDVVCLEGTRVVTCASSVPAPNEDNFDAIMMDSEQHMSQVWVCSKVCSKGYLDVFTYQHATCVGSKTIPLDTTMMICMCVVEETVWFADTVGTIHVYSLHNNRAVMQCAVVTPPACAISMIYILNLREVVVTLSNGSMLVCDAQFPTRSKRKLPTDTRPNSGAKLVKEHLPGNGQPVHCIVALPGKIRSFELWCGQGQGAICVWDLAEGMDSHDVLFHTDCTRKDVAVMFLSTSVHDKKSVWSYVYPGSQVYRWGVRSRRVVSRLNISKLIPESDRKANCTSLLENNLRHGKCQVTSMNVIYDEIYIGTTWGCIIIADQKSMRPLAVFRCHGSEANYIRSIVPLTFEEEMSTSEENGDHYQQRSLVTIGKGYVNLMERYLEPQSVNTKSSIFLLSWDAEDWKQSVT